MNTTSVGCGFCTVRPVSVNNTLLSWMLNSYLFRCLWCGLAKLFLQLKCLHFKNT